MIFCPRRLRFLAAYGILLLEFLIFLTGNYNWFNLQTMLLCLPLFDDRAVKWALPSRLRGPLLRRARVIRLGRVASLLAGTLALLIVFCGLVEMDLRFGGHPPGPALAIDEAIEPLHIVSAYGLFAEMTTRRNEIVIEGSDDGLNWLEYGFVPAFNISTAALVLISGQAQAAIHMLEAIPADASAGRRDRNLYLAEAYAAAGRYSEAADTLLLIKADFVSRRSLMDAAEIIRSAPTKTKSPEALPALQGGLNFVYAYVGALDRVMENPERDLKSGWPGEFEGATEFWSPKYAPLRKTERFKEFVRNAGLVDYWRARGWPDLCHATTDDDFECN